jgi:hypothetical protein
MRISNYDEVRDALYHRGPFLHGSCHALRYDADIFGACREYRVWSYSTLVLVYNLDAGRVVYFDNRQYSQTTSHLQSMIRATFPNALPEGETRRLVYEY